MGPKWETKWDIEGRSASKGLWDPFLFAFCTNLGHFFEKNLIKFKLFLIDFVRYSFDVSSQQTATPISQPPDLQPAAGRGGAGGSGRSP